MLMSIHRRFIASAGLTAVAASLLAGNLAAQAPVSLAGPWRFQLDRADLGIGERWFARALPDKFTLPGSLPAAGIGDTPSLDTKWSGGVQAPKWFEEPRYAPYAKPDNFKFPFWLQPEKYYAGAAWFQRDFEVPKDWQGKRVVLFLERAHWETRVWVDGTLIGTNNSLSTPHEYELGIVAGSAAAPAAVRRALAPNTVRSDGSANVSPQKPTTRASSAAPEAGALPIQLAPGRHTVTIRVDNRRIVDIGENSHAITDHTQGNWNGIVGKIQLRATPLVWIEELQAYPHTNTGTVTVKGKLRNAARAAGHGVLKLVGEPLDGLVRARQKLLEVTWGASDVSFEAELELGERAKAWDEFSPVLCVLKASLDGGATQSVTFGLRDVSTDGTQLTVNGRKTFIRGTLECAIFPKTGHPPTDVGEWKRLIGVAKSYGLNLLRFHSYCPPEAAFQAADELGMYLQVETCWANQSTTIGDSKPVDQWVYDETDRILKYYGNHPSFLLMLHGNEPGGRNANAYLAKYVAHFKAKDPRRLWSSGSGWPQLAENQFHVTPDPRVQGWGQGLKSRINAWPPETTTDYRDYIAKRNVPVISHEIGQWCVYPNFSEIPKYNGYLKAKNFEIFRDLLDKNGMGKLAKPFLLASGKLQTLCYKEDIESALRTPGMGGFELLDLHDFPGQGTALVGVLDPFWEEKGYVTAAEYSQFCNSTVPLARLKKRVFTTDDTLEAEIEVANYGSGPIRPEPYGLWWLLLGEDGYPANGVGLPPTNIPIGEGMRRRAPAHWIGGFAGTNITTGGVFPIGRVSMALAGINAPAHYKLEVRVQTQATTSPQVRSGWTALNDWDIWVYPAAAPSRTLSDVLVTAQFDDAAQKHLASGGKLLLTLPGKAVRNFDTEPVKVGFSSIFWNTAWTGRQPPTTLGILCDPKHPALAEFPTEFHSNWQWWYLVHRAGALRLDLLPRGVEPIVRVIDDWFTARPLGLVVEGKVGKGKVIVCGFDLTRDADDPVSKQMRASLLAYMASKKFAPKTELTADQVQSLTLDDKSSKLGGVRSVRADSEQEGYEVEQVIDGDPATMWHTAWGDAAPGFPHHLVIEFDAPKRMTGFTALPRQDNNRNGWIKDYACYASADGQAWGEPVAQGTFARDAGPKAVRFAAPVTARFVKLVALSGHGDGPFASLAEFGPMEAK